MVLRLFRVYPRLRLVSCVGGGSGVSLSLFSAFKSLPKEESEEVGTLDKPSTFDAPQNYDKTAIKAGYQDRAHLDWKQRLKLMWRHDQYGNPSPELGLVIQCVIGSAFCGGIIGAFNESKVSYNKFEQISKHQMFKHPYLAQSAMQDKVFLGFFKGFAKSSWKYALMTGVFMGVGQSLSVLRNHINPLDYLAAGFTMGAGYRVFSGGLRGAVGGGIVGGALGLFGGCWFWAAQRLTGLTVEERWKKEYEDFTREMRIREREEREEREQRLSSEKEGFEAVADSFFNSQYSLRRTFEKNTGILFKRHTKEDDEDES